jgi:hypothetical protein
MEIERIQEATKVVDEVQKRKIEPSLVKTPT